MEESTDLQALENISTEVDESQVKIILSSQCIKAQSFLYDKLKKQAERKKELCNFISNSNLKLEAEIKIAELEVKSLNIAVETIKSANIELKKEYLLSKERKLEVIERTKIGKKKYEDLWFTSKNRYESIPLVQKWLHVKSTNQIIRDNIKAINEESQRLSQQIKEKQQELVALDTKRIIDLAQFVVYERPKLVEKIKEKSDKIAELSAELETAFKFKDYNKSSENSNTQLASAKRDEHNVQIPKDMKCSLVADNWPILSKNIDRDTLVIPKLHLQNNDLDILSVKLDQIKKTDLLNTTSMKRSSSCIVSEYENNSCKKVKAEDSTNDCYVSSYFNISININTGSDKKSELKNYSEKKLINILEDIKIDNNDAFDIIKKLQPTKFQETKYIVCPEVARPSEKFNESQDKLIEPFKSEEIEEIVTPIPDVVEPPSQFLDRTHNSQGKKTVSFNIPPPENLPNFKNEVSKKPEETVLNQSGENNNLNMSIASAESYEHMKEIILKKHHLDLSPKFVYSKNALTHMTKDNVAIKSSFFENDQANLHNSSHNENGGEKIEYIETIGRQRIKDDNNIFEDVDVNVDIVVASSPKNNNNLETKTESISVAGLLFNHGPQGLPDSLNVSISTTGYEDNEDFPQCIDSSILLSPKADFPTPAGTIDNEILSQDVPNFLSGFRKTGLSFFGGASASDSKPDSSEPNKSTGFNFMFGNEDKKSRGGLFSMFR